MTSRDQTRTDDEMNPPRLLVLPSGRGFRLDRYMDHEPFDRPNVQDGIRVHFDRAVISYRGEDAAAIKSAILRYGVEANAPTIKGEDADGDGKAGE